MKRKRIKNTEPKVVNVIVRMKEEGLANYFRRLKFK